MPTKKHAYVELSSSENHASRNKTCIPNMRNSAFLMLVTIICYMVLQQMHVGTSACS